MRRSSTAPSWPPPDSTARPRAEGQEEATGRDAGDRAKGGGRHPGASSDAGPGRPGEGEAGDAGKLALRALHPTGEHSGGLGPSVLLDTQVLEGK